MLKPVITFLLLVVLCTAETSQRFRSAGRLRSNTRFLARQQAASAPTPTGYPPAGVTPQIPFKLPFSTAKSEVTYLPPHNTNNSPSQPDVSYGPPPAPHNTYGPPDNTYLPPDDNDILRHMPSEVDESEVEIETDSNEREQQPTAPQPEIQDQPDEQTNEPDEDEEDEISVAVTDDGPVIAVSNSFDAQSAQIDTNVANSQKPARLVFQRFPQSRRGTPTDVAVPARLIKLHKRMATAKLQLPQRMQAQLQSQPQGLSFMSQYTTW